MAATSRLLLAVVVGAVAMRVPIDRPELPFRVFAATYNSGNAILSSTAREQLAGELVEGHDNVSNAAADIVLLGFQEFKDKDWELGLAARSKVLWQKQRGQVVPWYAKVFKSGHMCKFARHFNTKMYAYVRPGSPWNVEAVQYNSETCIAARSSGLERFAEQPGCTLEFNTRWECGKVVNLLVFQVSRNAASLRLCAFNTHMSFSGPASRRMKYISLSMDEAAKAGCNATIFVGDFNTRLHCLAHPQNADTVPFFDQRPQTGSSFQHQLNTFCNQGDKCSLTSSPHMFADELTQMLHWKNLTCFEKVARRKKTKSAKTKKAGSETIHSDMKARHTWQVSDLRRALRAKRKRLESANADTSEVEAELGRLPPAEEGADPTEAGYHLFISSNSIVRNNYQLREAGPVEFRPTYKLAVKSKAPEYPPDFWSCLDQDGLCFANKEGDGKRNPAWTDRILVSSMGSMVSINTVSYTRRIMSPAISSDHAAVVAKLELTP